MTAITNGVATFILGRDRSKSAYYAARKGEEHGHAPHGAQAA